MSNKAISVYAEGLKRQREEEEKQQISPPSSSRVPVVTYAQKEPSQQGNKQTRKLVGNEVGKTATQETALEPDLPTQPELYRKQTFELGEVELNFLEDAKTACRQSFRFRMTKNEIVRTALEFLAKDFLANKQTSFLVRKFAGKEPSQQPWNK